MLHSPQPFLCVASSRSESTALIVAAGADSYQVVSGPPLNPHALDFTECQTALRSLLSEVYALAPSDSALPKHLIIAINGVLGAPEKAIMAAAASSSALGSVTLTFLDREDAKVLANEDTHESVINLHAGGASYALALPITEGVRIRVREGGHGMFSGADGGQYFIGSKVVEHILRNRDLGRETALGSQIRQYLNWTDTDDVMRWILRASQGEGLWEGLTGIARYTISLAHAGDAPALGIVTDAATHAAQRALRVQQRAFSGHRQKLVVGLSGSVSVSSPEYVSTVGDIIKSASITAEIRFFRIRSVVGCLRFHLEKVRPGAWESLKSLVVADRRLVNSPDVAGST